MKILTILSVILAVAASYPTVKTMTLLELSKVIELKEDPENQVYYINALNQIMENLYNGNDHFSLKVILSPSGVATWTIEELTHEIHSLEQSSASQEYKTAVIQAHVIYIEKEAMGINENTIRVVIPAMDISKWTKGDLDTAKNNKNTKTELLPYLEKAIAEMTKPGGELKDTIGMVTPVGIIPHEAYF